MFQGETDHITMTMCDVGDRERKVLTSHLANARF